MDICCCCYEMAYRLELKNGSEINIFHFYSLALLDFMVTMQILNTFIVLENSRFKKLKFNKNVFRFYI